MDFARRLLVIAFWALAHVNWLVGRFAAVAYVEGDMAHCLYLFLGVVFTYPVLPSLSTAKRSLSLAASCAAKSYSAFFVLASAVKELPSTIYQLALGNILHSPNEQIVLPLAVALVDRLPLLYIIAVSLTIIYIFPSIYKAATAAQLALVLQINPLLKDHGQIKVKQGEQLVATAEFKDKVGRALLRYDDIRAEGSRISDQIANYNHKANALHQSLYNVIGQILEVAAGLKLRSQDTLPEPLPATRKQASLVTWPALLDQLASSKNIVLKAVVPELPAEEVLYFVDRAIPFAVQANEILRGDLNKLFKEASELKIELKNQTAALRRFEADLEKQQRTQEAELWREEFAAYHAAMWDDQKKAEEEEAARQTKSEEALTRREQTPVDEVQTATPPAPQIVEAKPMPPAVEVIVAEPMPSTPEIVEATNAAALSMTDENQLVLAPANSSVVTVPLAVPVIAPSTVPAAVPMDISSPAIATSRTQNRMLRTLKLKRAQKAKLVGATARPHQSTSRRRRILATRRAKRDERRKAACSSGPESMEVDSGYGSGTSSEDEDLMEVDSDDEDLTVPMEADSEDEDLTVPMEEDSDDEDLTVPMEVDVDICYPVEMDLDPQPAPSAPAVAALPPALQPAFPPPQPSVPLFSAGTSFGNVGAPPAHGVHQLGPAAPASLPFSVAQSGVSTQASVPATAGAGQMYEPMDIDDGNGQTATTTTTVTQQQQHFAAAATLVVLAAGPPAPVTSAPTYTLSSWVTKPTSGQGSNLLAAAAHAALTNFPHPAAAGPTPSKGRPNPPAGASSSSAPLPSSTTVPAAANTAAAAVPPTGTQPAPSAGGDDNDGPILDCIVVATGPTL